MGNIKKIGFVGIGNMGNPMARHLVNAGFDLTVMDKRADIVEAFVKAHHCNSTANLVELGQSVDVVITMLPTSEVVRSVILGSTNGNGIVDGMSKGKLVIDMSTSNPADTLSLNEAFGCAKRICQSKRASFLKKTQTHVHYRIMHVHSKNALLFGQGGEKT